MSAELSWMPWEDIPDQEKIRRTKAAIEHYSRYTGPISVAMVKSKKELLERLETNARGQGNQ
jgi:hypothetical protein